LFYLDKLPERVASHFNISNKADSWMSRDSYTFFYYTLIVLTYILFWGLSALAPRFKPSLINLPNKEYWLTETRRSGTFRVVQTMLYWIGSACLLLFIYIYYEVAKANIDGSQQVSGFSWLSILLFLFLNAVIVIKYVLYFTKKENQSEEQ
jgi:uncharacterized membrane protein